MVEVGQLVEQWAGQLGVRHYVQLGLADPVKWADLVGGDLAGAGRPAGFVRGELVVEAVDQVSAARLRYCADAIRAVLNEAAGEDFVKRVIVRAPRRPHDPSRG
jgi:hypothetical protein